MAKTANAIVADASKLASTIKADGGFNKELGNDAKRTVESKMCVISLKEHLLSELTQEQIDALPVPGDGPEGNNPDKFEEKIPNSKRTRKSSFYKEFALRVPFVLRETRELALVKEYDPKAKNAEKTPDNPYRNRPSGWITGEIKAGNARVNAAVRRVTDSFRLLFQEARVQEEFGDVCELEYAKVLDKEGNEEMERRSNPIVLHRLFPAKTEDGKDHPKAGERFGIQRYLSVGEFLNLDVDKAKENGGTFDALLDSGARETPDKQTKLAEAVKTFGTMDDYLTSIWHFIQDRKAFDGAANYLNNPDNASFRKVWLDVSIFMDKVAEVPSVKRNISKTVDGEEEEKVA